MSPWFATDASRQETPPAAWRPWKGYDRRPWKGYDQPADEVAIDIEGYGELLAEAFSSEPVQTTPSRVEPLSMQKLKLHVTPIQPRIVPLSKHNPLPLNCNLRAKISPKTRPTPKIVQKKVSPVILWKEMKKEQDGAPDGGGQAAYAREAEVMIDCQAASSAGDTDEDGGEQAAYAWEEAEFMIDGQAASSARDTGDDGGGEAASAWEAESRIVVVGGVGGGQAASSPGDTGEDGGGGDGHGNGKGKKVDRKRKSKGKGKGTYVWKGKAKGKSAVVNPHVPPFRQCKMCGYFTHMYKEFWGKKTLRGCILCKAWDFSSVAYVKRGKGPPW